MKANNLNNSLKKKQPKKVVIKTMPKIKSQAELMQELELALEKYRQDGEQYVIKVDVLEINLLQCQEKKIKNFCEYKSEVS